MIEKNLEFKNINTNACWITHENKLYVINIDDDLHKVHYAWINSWFIIVSCIYNSNTFDEKNIYDNFWYLIDDELIYYSCISYFEIKNNIKKENLEYYQKELLNVFHPINSNKKLQNIDEINVFEEHKNIDKTIDIDKTNDIECNALIEEIIKLNETDEKINIDINTHVNNTLKITWDPIIIGKLLLCIINPNQMNTGINESLSI